MKPWVRQFQFFSGGVSRIRVSERGTASLGGQSALPEHGLALSLTIPIERWSWDDSDEHIVGGLGQTVVDQDSEPEAAED